MNELRDNQGDPTGRSGVYRIVVKGTLDPHWSNRLAGMSIRPSSVEGEEPQTVLSGWLRDQAQLSGVLNTVVGLHLSIQRVERIPRDERDSS